MSDKKKGRTELSAELERLSMLSEQALDNFREMHMMRDEAARLSHVLSARDQVGINCLSVSPTDISHLRITRNS